MAMRYRILGRTGLHVSELALGTMTFGGGPFWGAIGSLDAEAATAVVKAAFEAGINLFDTADVYAGGRSEELLGQAIATLGLPRGEIIIATKVHERVGPGPNGGGSTRKRILAGIDESLRRLGLDHVDLYQLHGVDPLTDPAETLEALDAVVRAGKARHAGVCNFPGWRVQQLLGLAESRRLAAPVSQQVYYSLAGRDAEREVLPQAEAASLGLLVWSPLAGGLLSGKFDPLAPGAGPEGARRTGFDFPPVNRPRAAAVIEAARPIATAHGAGLAELALAWLLTRPAVTSVITGVKTVAQLTANLRAVELARALTAEQLAALDAASALPAEYPGWMVAYQAAQRSPEGARPDA